MAFTGLLITEIFKSIQGEGSQVGMPFTFIRLTGCNLRCSYCDTAYAFKGGSRMTEGEVLQAVEALGCNNILLTGGEPLLQRGTLSLLHALKSKGYEVSIETHGEVSIKAYVSFARIILDIKTPGSGMHRGGYVENLPLLKPIDEIKFVITSETDYEWSKSKALEIRAQGLTKAKTLLFSPAATDSGGMPARTLAESILRDNLPVRFQLQLHKTLWGAESRGV
jgi:7-carboxy-7-deazaguanine synthase